MKVIKLRESSSDAKNKFIKPYKGVIPRKPKNPYESYRAAKTIREMDNSVAWALNDATNTTIGDWLESNLPTGTLSEFMDSFKWEELYPNIEVELDNTSSDEYTTEYVKDNVFINLLKVANGLDDKKEYLGDYKKFVTIYNGYVNDIYDQNIVNSLKNEKGSGLDFIYALCVEGGKNNGKKASRQKDTLLKDAEKLSDDDRKSLLYDLAELTGIEINDAENTQG